jgi:hypothetical protein
LSLRDRKAANRLGAREAAHSVRIALYLFTALSKKYPHQSIVGAIIGELPSGIQDGPAALIRTQLG